MLPEVLAQEPSLGTLWLIYGGIAFVGFLLCRWRPWLCYVLLPGFLLLDVPLVMELYDPEIAAALLRHAPMYFIEANLLIVLTLVLPYLGALRSRRVSRPAEPAARPGSPALP